jgi:hypothetical protein
MSDEQPQAIQAAIEGERARIVRMFCAKGWGHNSLTVWMIENFLDDYPEPEPPDMDALDKVAGIIPWQEGDELAEVTIGRLRDGG